MGQQGYQQVPTMAPDQQSLFRQMMSGQGGDSNVYGQAMKGLSSFLPGGGGFAPIEAQARQGFQQQTLPQIMNAMGRGSGNASGGSSALNQALASAAQGLETNLASQKAQSGLQASGQALGSAQGLMGQQSFAYLPEKKSFGKEAMLASIPALTTFLNLWLNKPNEGTPGSTPGSGGLDPSPSARG